MVALPGGERIKVVASPKRSLSLVACWIYLVLLAAFSSKRLWVLLYSSLGDAFCGGVGRYGRPTFYARDDPPQGPCALLRFRPDPRVVSMAGVVSVAFFLRQYCKALPDLGMHIVIQPTTLLRAFM